MSIVLVFLLMSLYHVDILMLQQFRESSDVGNYRAALQIAEFLWFVPLALQTVFVHSTSELWSRNRTREITDLASRTTRYTFLLTGVMAVGLAALADVAIPLYFGAEAEPAIDPLLLLLPGALGSPSPGRFWLSHRGTEPFAIPSPPPASRPASTSSSTSC